MEKRIYGLDRVQKVCFDLGTQEIELRAEEPGIPGLKWRYALQALQEHKGGGQ